MKTTKIYIVKESMKNAREYFQGQIVIAGLYNHKPAVFVTCGELNLSECVMVYSATSGRYLGAFVQSGVVTIEKAKGAVLIAK